ncbi:sugar kinase [Altererythrobacter aurantiacus]|uniref:Sugar kinase n=1 Tax=Parapontixanthobacter aurantiacus TaxID=1463599 RepID=A0A844ZBD3_9SPHN|nr:sugar kinase [Parapontixanthobacter aurantiacus]MXO84423.1 sugar kinase [Parapontixanthobacter aurantiacus]
MTSVVACFGEVLLRFAASDGATLRDTTKLDVHVGGAEANVAVALANLGIATRMISALPDNPLGTLALKTLRREGVDTAYLATGKGRMGTYFLTPAAGSRGGEVLYDREGSVFSSGDAVSPTALHGATHLHVSGISLAVSSTASATTRALTKEAKQRGLTLSFDGNYRPSLWQATGRDGRDEIAEMVDMADLFFGNYKDASLLLGREFSGENGSRMREAALALLNEFSSLKAVSSTARHIENGTTHRISARIDSRNASAESEERSLTGIIDRIGTGDAFAAGVLANWLEDPEDLQSAVDSGLALSAMKHYEPGDFCRATRPEWKAALKGSEDVSR